MGENEAGFAPPEGLSERVMREVLRTAPVKELMLLPLKDIDPHKARGLVRAMLWEDPGVSLSFLGALPDAVNWLVEFLLELGRQLNELPEALFKDFLAAMGKGIDGERLEQLPPVYAQLLGRLLASGETAGQAQAITGQVLNAVLAGADSLTSRLDENREEIGRSMAAAVDGMDTGALGRTINRMVRLSNAYSRHRQVPLKAQCREVLSQVEAREALTALKNILRSTLVMGWALLRWSMRASRKGP